MPDPPLQGTSMTEFNFNQYALMIIKRLEQLETEVQDQRRQLSANQADFVERLIALRITILQNLETSFGTINTRCSLHDKEITALKIKAGIWGLLGGLIPATTMLIVLFLK